MTTTPPEARATRFSVSVAPFVAEAVEKFLTRGTVARTHVGATSTLIYLTVDGSTLHMSSSSMRSLTDLIHRVMRDKTYLGAFAARGPVDRNPDPDDFMQLSNNDTVCEATVALVKKQHPEFVKMHREMRDRLAPELSQVTIELRQAREASARRALRKLFSALRRLKMTDPEIVQFVRDEVDLQNVERIMKS